MFTKKKYPVDSIERSFENSPGLGLNTNNKQIFRLNPIDSSLEKQYASERRTGNSRRLYWLTVPERINVSRGGRALHTRARARPAKQLFSVALFFISRGSIFFSSSPRAGTVFFSHFSEETPLFTRPPRPCPRRQTADRFAPETVSDLSRGTYSERTPRRIAYGNRERGAREKRLILQ